MRVRKKPRKVTLTDGVCVAIEGNYALCAAFMKWLCDTPDVANVPHTGGSSGLGNYYAVFEAKAKPALEAWFAAHSDVHDGDA